MAQNLTFISLFPHFTILVLNYYRSNLNMYTKPFNVLSDDILRCTVCKTIECFDSNITHSPRCSGDRDTGILKELLYLKDTCVCV